MLNYSLHSYRYTSAVTVSSSNRHPVCTGCLLSRHVLLGHLEPWRWGWLVIPNKWDYHSMLRTIPEESRSQNTFNLTCICLMVGGLLVKTWRQSDTRRDVRALHDVTSDMSHEGQDFFTWLLQANAHPASHISQYDNSHPFPCFWILLEFRNTVVRVRSRVIRNMIIEL